MNVSTIDDAIMEDESRLMIMGVIQNEKKMKFVAHTRNRWLCEHENDISSEK